MAVLNVVYTHAGDPGYEGSRRKTVKEMEDFITDLVYDIRFAGISCSFESVEGDVNDVTVNGRRVRDIIEDLGTDIRRPVLDENGNPKTTTRIGRGSGDWNDGCIEDISAILMKNALSKAYADTRGGKRSDPPPAGDARGHGALFNRNADSEAIEWHFWMSYTLTRRIPSSRSPVAGRSPR